MERGGRMPAATTEPSISISVKGLRPNSIRRSLMQCSYLQDPIFNIWIKWLVNICLCRLSLMALLLYSESFYDISHYLSYSFDWFSVCPGLYLCIDRKTAVMRVCRLSLFTWTLIQTHTLLYNRLLHHMLCTALLAWWDERVSISHHTQAQS